MIHLLIGGAKVKTVRSHLTVNDLARLFSEGAVNAGPSPMPPIEDGAAVEVDRSICSGGTTSLDGKDDPRGGDPRGPPGCDSDRAADAEVLRPRHP